MQPGDSITPENNADSGHPSNQPDQQQESEPSETAPQQADSSTWKYTEDEAVSPVSSTLSPIAWSASEYIDHEKRAGWFLSVGGIAAVLAAVIYLLTRDVINSIVIIVVAGLFAASGARKPHTLEYNLDARGLRIGPKFYGYNLFKSFAVMEEDAISSIQLFQFKRFSTPITLYFPPEQEQAIVDFIGSYLPHETRKHDPIDRLMRKVRF